MPRYSLPLEIIVYADIEANNLEEAIEKVSLENVKEINYETILNYRVSASDCLFKDDEILQSDDNEDLLLIDIVSQEQLNKY